MTEEVKRASEKKKEDWMNSKWRPMMGWMYMVVCIMDMVIFPILWSLLQTFTHTQITQWNPLTLQGAGLFHIAMGAVLGLAAWGRTQEKLSGANNGGLQATGSGFTSGATTFSQPSSGFGQQPVSYNSPAQNNFTGNTSFASAGGVGSNTVVTGFGGKPAPVQPEYPVI